ncbi:MAG: type II secretion system F family protein [Anaerolineales bacterium]
MNPLVLGIIAFLVVIWGVGIGAVILTYRRQSAAETRLGELTQGVQVVTSPTETGPRPGLLMEGLNRALAGRSFAEGISRDLARADIKITVGEYLALHLILALGLGFITAFLRQNVIAGVLVGVIALFIPRIYVGNRKRSRLSRFDGQLPDMLNLVVNGLRAGYSVTQALEAVSRELPPPISVEFRRVVQEMQLGLPPDAALSNLTRRIPSKDLDFVVTAMNVQREVGGNLAEILDTISFTIRERIRIRGEIETLTAQGRMTGIVISLLPVGMGILLYVLNPDYMGQFFIADSFWLCGYGALALAAVLIIVGWAAVMKIVDIEV